MKLLAILPVRSGSKTIPNKNIAILNGYHLLSYAINAAKDISSISNLLVSSDSEHYLKIASYYSDNLILRKRPLNLACDETPDIPVLIDALDFAEDKLNTKFSHIMQLHATSPLLTREHLSKALDDFSNSSADSMVSVKSASETPPIKIKKIVGDFLVPAIAGLQEITTSRRQDNKNFYIRNGAFYIVSSENLRKGRLWGDKVKPYIMNKFESIDINDNYDLELAELILKKKK